MDLDGTSEMSTFDGLVRGFAPDDRKAFEAACERIEDLLRRPDTTLTLAGLLDEVPPQGPVRRAVLIHLGKLWLEAQHDAGQHTGLDDLLGPIPELAGDPLATRTLNDWANQLALANPPSTTTLPRFRAASFILPEPYELLETLQDEPGRMSVVLLVNNKRLKRKEVLKALNPARLNNPAAVRRFLEEPASASQTQHPGIIRVYHAGDESSPCPYYTMEYLEGGSLADLVTADPLAPVQAAKYLAIVARALHHVHATLQLAHGDIKPENILLNGEREPKLTDFGLSRPAVPTDASASSSIMVAGTPGYLAPEQLDLNLCPEGYDPHRRRIAGDLFALGATLYCCLTRRIPYQSDSGRPSPFAALANALVPPSELNPAVDERLDAICARSLRKQPDQRYATAADLADALEAWLAHALLEPTPEPEPKPESIETAKPGTTAPGSSWGELGEGVRIVEDPPTGWAAARSLLGRWEWAAAGGVLLLLMFLWLRAGEADGGKHRDRERDITKKTRDDDGRRDGNTTRPPGTSVASATEALVAGGWNREAAAAVAALNGPWLQAVRQVDPKLADRQVESLARLGRGALSLDFCRETPEAAAMLAGLVTDEDQRIAADALGAANPVDVKLAQRLFTLHPSTRGMHALTRLFADDTTLLRDLGRHGWVGPEVSLFPSDDSEAERVYRAWLEQIVRRRLANANDEDSRRQAAEFLTFAVVSGPALKVRLGRDASFRARFLDDIWAPLVTLIDEGVFGIPDVLGVEAIWDFLAREGPSGRDLLREFKLAPVALLYGKHAEDFDGMHDRIVNLLTSRNKTLVKSLFNPAFRGRKAFRALLEKEVPAAVLAVAFEEAAKKPPELERFAALSPADLKGELELYWNPEAERNVEGRWVYVVVARKWLTGETVYTWEQNALTRQAVYDVAVAALTYAGAGPAAEQTLDTIYWGTINSIKEGERARRQEVLAASKERLSKDDQAQIAATRATPADAPPTDLVPLFVQTRRMVQAVQDPSLSARSAGAGAGAAKAFDLGAVARMYRTMLEGSPHPAENGADRPSVRLLLLDGGLLAVNLAPADGPAARGPRPVREFFNERSNQLIGSSPDADEAALTAWRQSASAWWLIHATRQLDLLDR